MQALRPAIGPQRAMLCVFDRIFAGMKRMRDVSARLVRLGGGQRCVEVVP